MNEFRLTHLRMPEVTEAKFEVAVFPIGSTEPHAFHLAYGTDLFAVERFAERAVAKANEQGAKCLLLPTLPISCNENVRHCPWAMSLQPRTLMDIVLDVVTTCERNGVRKVIIINGHGGNTHVLQASLRELASKSSAFVGFTEQFGLSADVEAELQETAETGHACEMETSVLLYLAPEHAKMDEAKPTRTRKSVFSDPRSIFFVKPWHIYTLNCGIGDPTKATADKGRRMVDTAVDRLAQALKELSDAPIDQLFPMRD